MSSLNNLIFDCKKDVTRLVSCCPSLQKWKSSASHLWFLGPTKNGEVEVHLVKSTCFDRWSPPVLTHVFPVWFPQTIWDHWQHVAATRVAAIRQDSAVAFGTSGEPNSEDFGEISGRCCWYFPSIHLPSGSDSHSHGKWMNMAHF